MRNALALAAVIAALSANAQSTADLASHSAGPWGVKLTDRDPSVVRPMISIFRRTAPG
jgi:hypothetical protein